MKGRRHAGQLQVLQDPRDALWTGQAKDQIASGRHGDAGGEGGAKNRYGFRTVRAGDVLRGGKLRSPINTSPRWISLTWSPFALGVTCAASSTRHASSKRSFLNSRDLKPLRKTFPAVGERRV
jgi:hypothetical protein